MTESGKIPLADLINKVRAELFRAASTAPAGEPRFVAQEVELELQVGVTSSQSGEAELDLWAFSLGGSTDYASEQIQTIRLKLKPETADGRPYKTSDTEPRD